MIDVNHVCTNVWVKNVLLTYFHNHVTPTWQILHWLIENITDTNHDWHPSWFTSIMIGINLVSTIVCTKKKISIFAQSKYNPMSNFILIVWTIRKLFSIIELLSMKMHFFSEWMSSWPISRRRLYTPMFKKVKATFPVVTEVILSAQMFIFAFLITCFYIW